MTTILLHHYGLQESDIPSMELMLSAIGDKMVPLKTNGIPDSESFKMN